MFLTVHSTAGIVLATSTINPIGAFILGFLSHYILDMIPHGDENIHEMLPDKYSDNARIAVWAVADVIIAILVWFFLFKSIILASPIIIFAGIIGAMLPDFLQAIYMLTNTKILKAVNDVHNFAHTLLNHPIPFRYGLIIQLIFFVLLANQLLGG